MGSAPPKVVGRYALFGDIASGGMATVHYGRQLGAVGFARTVAIKRLHPHIAMNSEFVAMFLDEANLVARIRHPNVVPTLDVLAQDGELWLVMEYIHGESLSRVLRALGPGVRVPIDVAMAVTLGLLSGLHAAHDARDESGAPLGIVHRDVSPQNVLIGDDGVVRVLDFGVAKATGRLQQTEQGQLKGKYAYMSPEQLQQDPLDRRSDVFCVGAILWELLVGRRLFAGESPAAIAYAMVMEPVPAPSTLRADVPSEVERVVLRALARDPAQRFASADEMAQALEDACRPATTRKVQEWLRSTVAASLEVRAKTVAEIEAWVVPEERPATREALESILLSTAPTPAITRTPSQVRAALGLPPIATDERGRIGSISGISNAESVVRTSSPELHTQLTSAEPLPSPASPERRASSRVGALLVVSVSAVLVLGAFTIMRGRVSSGTDDPAHAASPPATATPSVESAGSTAPRASTPTALVIAEASASASAGATASAAPEVRPQSKPWSLPSFPLGPRPGAPTAAPTAPTKPASCENPFTIDANGRKRPRPECF